MKAHVGTVEEAACCLKRGGVITYPTETAYAVGADALNVEAVQRVREVKGRDEKPITVIVPDLETMGRYAYLGRRAHILVKAFMPGPLTLVVDKKEVIPPILDKEEIAFRISSHEKAWMLSRIFGGLITATSANLSGEPPLYTMGEVVRTFSEKVDLMVNGGDLERRPVSTVISLRADIPLVRREGALPSARIFEVLREHGVFEYGDYRREDFEVAE